MSENENQTPATEETSTNDSAPMTTTPPEGTDPSKGLNVGDLKKMVQIIQTCTKRGAFNADELSVVGEVYSNLVKFLVATGAIKPAPAPEQSADAQTETPSAPEETTADVQPEPEAEAEDSTEK
jgi:hypothetical protein